MTADSFRIYTWRYNSKGKGKDYKEKNGIQGMGKGRMEDLK